MAHALEGLKPDSRFTSYDIIENQVTALMSEMWAVKELVNSTDAWKDMLEHWRDELVFIRNAVRALAPTIPDLRAGLRRSDGNASVS